MKKISAMIFAAGLGQRLLPLTASKPKALVEINGKTLLEHAINKITAAGIDYIVVNTHHFAEQIEEFIKTHNFAAEIVISHEKEKLMDTAGGLKYAGHFFQNNNSILLYNVDILSSIDLNAMYDYHLQNKAIATLAVRHRDTQRYLGFNQEDKTLCSWKNIKTGEEIIVKTGVKTINLAFSGIHFVERKIIDTVPENETLSLVSHYLSICSNNKIIGYIHDADNWQDCGKYQTVLIN